MLLLFPRFCAYFLLQTLQHLLVGAQKCILPPDAKDPYYAIDHTMGALNMS